MRIAVDYGEPTAGLDRWAAFLAWRRAGISTRIPSRTSNRSVRAAPRSCTETRPSANPGALRLVPALHPDSDSTDLLSGEVGRAQGVQAGCDGHAAAIDAQRQGGQIARVQGTGDRRAWLLSTSEGGEAAEGVARALSSSESRSRRNRRRTALTSPLAEPFPSFAQVRTAPSTTAWAGRLSTGPIQRYQQQRFNLRIAGRLVGARRNTSERPEPAAAP